MLIWRKIWQLTFNCRIASSSIFFINKVPSLKKGSSKKPTAFWDTEVRQVDFNLVKTSVHLKCLFGVSFTQCYDKTALWMFTWKDADPELIYSLCFFFLHVCYCLKKEMCFKRECKTIFNSSQYSSFLCIFTGHGFTLNKYQ